MHTLRKMWALPSAGALLLGLVALTPVPAIAASGTAIIDGIRRDPGSSLVPVTGSCLPTDGRTTAQLFLRGPGSSTNIVFSGAASVDPFGNLTGSVTVPANAVAGSIYKVSAQCTDQGQAAGPESTGIPLPAPGTAFASFDQRGLPVPPSSTTTTTVGATTGATPQTPRGTAGATTSRATPITRQPQFTG